MKMLLVHGFTQNAQCFGAFAKHLRGLAAGIERSSISSYDTNDARLLPASTYGAPGSTATLQMYRHLDTHAYTTAITDEIYSVDLPGHGRSSAISKGPWDTAEMLGNSFGKGTYIGYSMGARICLHLALSSPELVEKLVLISATGGIEDEAERDRRRISDELIARELEEGRDMGAFLRRWTEQPLFATMPQHTRMIAERMHNTPVGLASSLRMCGAGACDPLWDRLDELKMPVLIVAGMLDNRYVYSALRMASLVSNNSRISLIPGAGHACHLERPRIAASVIASFLAASRHNTVPIISNA
ncbi:MAG: alpha/beta fold hydrolase [Acidimicrobiales bacterium]